MANKNEELVTINNNHREEVFIKALNQLKKNHEDIFFRLEEHNIRSLIDCADLPRCNELLLDFLKQSEVELMNREASTNAFFEKSSKCLSTLTLLKGYLQTVLSGGMR